MAERWLVIDDSSTIQRVIKLAFQGYDVHITEADSCQDAAREMMSSIPSLVIADAALGGVQGVQDFLALKAQAPQAPFIILEGSYDNIDEEQFRAAGFRHFLKKPFDGSQLLSITRQALGRALPYRGEAAVAAAAGAPQPAPAQSPTMTMPPPPPPMRAGRAMTENGSAFASEGTNPGFDLGLHATRAPDPRAIAQTLVSTVDPRQMTADPRAMAQTQISTNMASNAHDMHDKHSEMEARSMGSEPRGGGSATGHSGDLRAMINAEARSMTSSHLNAMSQSGNFGRKEMPVETTRNAVSFSLEDDEPIASQPAALASRDKDPASWDGLPRPAGSHLGNLLEPMLQEEMEKIVRVAVEDYCRKHFAGIARELIQRELDRLTQDRSRLLMD